MAISALAYVLAVALHEQAGHGVACIAVGSRLTEIGAFYVSCDDHFLNPRAGRLVEIAGPLMSLVTGLVCLFSLRLVRPTRAAGAYFVWLLGALGVMNACGYLLFSGVTGLGDLGTGEEGAFHGINHAWLVRVLMVGLGAVLYWRGVLWALSELEPRFRTRDGQQIHVARKAASTSYWTGAAVYLLVGLLNPHGWTVVLTSALPSGMGGSSGLLWMMQRIGTVSAAPGPGLYFPRRWGIVVGAVVITVLYAVVFGPTFYPHELHE